MNAELLSLLQVAISEIEQVVNQALGHYAAFKGVTDFKGRVTLNTELTVDDIDRMVTGFLAYKDEIVQNLPWRKAHLKKVVALEEFSEEDKADIYAEIDKLKAVEPLSGVASLTGVADALTQNGSGPQAAPQNPGDPTGRVSRTGGGGAGPPAQGVPRPKPQARARSPRQ